MVAHQNLHQNRRHGSTAQYSRRAKHDLRIATYGAVDEANAAIGLARLYTGAMQLMGAFAGGCKMIYSIWG